MNIIDNGGRENFRKKEERNKLEKEGGGEERTHIEVYYLVDAETFF